VLIYQLRIELSKPVSIISAIFLFQTIPEGFIVPSRFAKGIETALKIKAGLKFYYVSFC